MVKGTAYTRLKRSLDKTLLLVRVQYLPPKFSCNEFCATFGGCRKVARRQLKMSDDAKEHGQEAKTLDFNSR